MIVAATGASFADRSNLGVRPMAGRPQRSQAGPAGEGVRDSAAVVSGNAGRRMDTGGNLPTDPRHVPSGRRPLMSCVSMRGGRDRTEETVEKKEKRRRHRAAPHFCRGYRLLWYASTMWLGMRPRSDTS